jgi:Tfp pilus assembly protein PilF/peroxiredoxin
MKSDRRVRVSRTGLVLLLAGALAPLATGTDLPTVKPRYRTTSAVEALFAQAEPGHDAFPSEKSAEEIGRRLERLSTALIARGPQADAVADLLAAEFRGGRLSPADETPVTQAPHLQVSRSRAWSRSMELDRPGFVQEFTRWLQGYDRVLVAEFEIIAIEPDASAPLASVTVAFDLVGSAPDAWREQRTGHWAMRWRRDADGAWRVLEWTGLDQTTSRSTGPAFVDATALALSGSAEFTAQFDPGVDQWRRVLDAAVGPDVFGNNGVAAGDIDGDGRDDFYVCQPSGLPNRLFRNRGDGTFEDVTRASPDLAVLDASSMALFVDVDNDGDADLVVVTWREPLLFINDGHGRFSHRPRAFQFARPPRGAFTSAAMADYDRDGALDLYVCSYSYFLGEGAYRLAAPYHDARNGPPNVLFRNDGTGRFVDVTDETGLGENNDRFSFACAWGDYDEDGWPDLFVANDFGRKNLYHNNGRRDGRVTFTDVAGAAGVEDHGAGMSAAWIDVNNDGHLDLYAGNMWSAAGLRATAQRAFQPQATPEVLALYRRHARGNSLFLNRGDGTFTDETLDAHAEKGRWAWSSDAIDFDGDGWQDLYVANGFVSNTEPRDLSSFFWRQVVAASPLTATPSAAFEDGWRAINRLIRAEGTWAGRERNVLLRNDGQGRFDDVSGAVGLDLLQDGRAFAVADYDGDGDPDLLLTSRTGPRLRYFRNDLHWGHSAVSFRLVGARSNRDAVGARVTVETDHGRYTRFVSAGSGFLSQHSKELLFGLGEARSIRTVEITWPSGTRQSFSGLPIGHRISIEEGRDAPLRVVPFRPPSTPSVPTLPPRPPLAGATWLYERYPAPEFELKDVSGAVHRLGDHRGHPVLLTLWSPTCMPCPPQLADLERNHSALRQAGLTIFLLSVDDASAADAARRRAVAFPVLPADEQVVGIYNLVHRHLFDRTENLGLPTSLLIDTMGRIARIYRGPTDVARVVQDAADLDAAPEALLARAVPFTGTFYGPPPGRNDFQIGIAFAEKGFDRQAVAEFERTVAKTPRHALAQYDLGTLYARHGRAADARRSFERALEARPDYAEAHNNLGSLLAAEGRVTEAIQHFEAALRSRPDYPDALNNLGYAYMQTGRAGEALLLFEKALKLQPDFAEASNNLGIYYGSRGDLARAADYFRQAIDKRPAYSEASNNLALAYAAQGHTDDAVRLLEKTLEQDPGFEITYLTLGRLYATTGRRQDAVRVLERLLEKKPTHPAALKLLAQLKSGA